MTLALLLAAGCSSDEKAPPTPTPTAAPAVVVDHSQDPFRIVVSLPIFGDMAREIVGNQGVVTTLIPAGVDPQTYVPTDDQIEVVANAQMIFYNGLGMETPTEQFIDRHYTRPAFVLDFAGNIPSPSIEQPPGDKIYADERGDDPRLFLDPQLGVIYPETIADTMVIKDGQNAAFYNSRYAEYKRRIEEMEGKVRSTLSGIPKANKQLLITHHNSLIHFANRYGLAVAGTSVDQGADGLADVIADKNPPAVFTETGYDGTVLQNVATAAGIEVCNLDTDAVSDAGISYIQMMLNDADEIARCLGAPAAASN